MSDEIHSQPLGGGLPPPVPGGYGCSPRAGVRPAARVSWAVWVLLVLITLLILPTLVEQVEFAVTRGRERAQAEVAQAQLASGRPLTIADYRYVVKAVQRSVVGVKASRIVRGQQGDELSFLLFGQGPRWREQDQGSGVIVDVRGYVITNNHVVDHASQVSVELSDGSQHPAKILGIDPGTDLAVLKLDVSGLAAARWGDSAAMEVGDPVLAIGSPFGLAQTVTAGILSAKGRHAVVENVSYQDFLQTDAAVNPGNSGGPLVNMKGEVVGINTAIVGPTYQGISFAIPSDMARRVYEQLISVGKVARGWLGVSMQELTPELAEKLDLHVSNGALVSGVLPGSPAERAGFKPGDVVVKWNGKAIHGPSELSMEVAWTKVGQQATATIVREGQEKTLSVTVGERPPQPKP
ncbi:MAG: trypsin-like peptidase domain-containing protein [Thermoguttaceae bacterium]|jgi:serine protease Do